MNYNQHVKTAQIAAQKAWGVFSETTQQWILELTKAQWRELNTQCCWAITEDKRTGDN